METAVLGLPMSGKSTLFAALTGSAPPPTGLQQDRPLPGVVKVLDPRLEVLASIFRPRRVVPAEVTLLDLPGAPEDLGRSQGIGGRFLNQLQGVDALLLVVRAFDDPSVPHLLDGVDPLRDVRVLMDELALSDLSILERRMERLAVAYKGARPAQREELDRERDLLERLRQTLEAGRPLRELSLSPGEARAIEGFQLLTAKPAVVALNVGEEEVATASDLARRLEETVAGPRVAVVHLCAQLEMELAQMEPQEAQEFRSSLGLGPSGTEAVLSRLLEVAGLVTFFTAVPGKEVRAWTVPRGSTAQEAAGRIHTDMARGFIRAEVIPVEELAECGGLTEARRRGRLRSEGKGYLVQDGDFITVLFNV